MYGVIIGCHDTSVYTACLSSIYQDGPGYVVFPGLEVEQYAIAYCTSKLFSEKYGTIPI